MRMRSLALVPSLAFALLARPAWAQFRETATVDTATAVFAEVMAIPEGAIPPALLDGAQAIAIVPGVLKAGFFAGVRHGKGVLVVRAADGSWSNPAFVALTGGSFGLQAGAQATDLVLVFKNRRSLDGFLAGRGKFTLGTDPAVAAGPVGRQAEAGTDARLSSEIYSYSRSRGLFAGLSLEGAALTLDRRADLAFYGQPVSPAEILGGADLRVPRPAARLKAWLGYYTRPPLPPLDDVSGTR